MAIQAVRASVKIGSFPRFFKLFFSKQIVFVGATIVYFFVTFLSPRDAISTVFSIPDGDSVALINAINTANSTTTPDIINLAINGKYVLTTINNHENGLPIISSDITINGNGSTIERSPAAGIALFRIFFIDPAGTLVLDSVTVTGAHVISHPGGGILNGGELRLINTSVATNRADGGAGVYNINGHLEALNSVISGNIDRFYGAGLWNHGASAVATLVDSSISGNSGRLRGTGVYNLAGSVTLIRSLVSNNSNGAGVMNHLFRSKLVLINSTVSGNTHNPAEGGGGVVNMGALTEAVLLNSTIVSNTHVRGAGGVINEDGVVTLKNTIVASNSPIDLFGTFTTLGHNLLKSPGSANVVGSGVGDLVGLDPLLGPLVNNGGATLTHRPNLNSPVIDVVSAVDCTDGSGSPVLTDQRSINRPQGSGCDIGAVEISAKHHNSKVSEIHRKYDSSWHDRRVTKVHDPKVSDHHNSKVSEVHRKYDSSWHDRRVTKVHDPKVSEVHRKYDSSWHDRRVTKVHDPKVSDHN